MVEAVRLFAGEPFSPNGKERVAANRSRRSALLQGAATRSGWKSRNSTCRRRRAPPRLVWTAPGRPLASRSSWTATPAGWAKTPKLTAGPAAGDRCRPEEIGAADGRQKQGDRLGRGRGRAGPIPGGESPGNALPGRAWAADAAAGRAGGAAIPGGPASRGRGPGTFRRPDSPATTGRSSNK